MTGRDARQLPPRQRGIERRRHLDHVPARRRRRARPPAPVGPASVRQRYAHRLLGSPLTPRPPRLELTYTYSGLIPPDGILGLSEAGTNRDPSLVANKPASRIDALDRAMVIFCHPADAVSGRLRDKYRRVDLIVSRWGSWGSAVVGVRRVRSCSALRLFSLFWTSLCSPLALFTEDPLTLCLPRDLNSRTAVDRIDAV